MQGALTSEQMDILNVITTRDEAGRHFVELYDAEDLDALESQGYIEVNRRGHAVTGMQYDSSYWTVGVTEEGLKVLDSGW